MTSPVLPEVITAGDTADELLAYVPDALAAALEAYQETGRPLPSGLFPTASTPWFHHGEMRRIFPLHLNAHFPA
jgi:hypothetical protein